MEIRKSKSPTELWDWFVNREAWAAGTIIMQIICARFKAAAIAGSSSSFLPSSRGRSWLELEKNNLKLWRWNSVDYLLLLHGIRGHLELTQQPLRVLWNPTVINIAVRIYFLVYQYSEFQRGNRVSANCLGRVSTRTLFVPRQLQPV